jgi:hypothetical protein
VGIRGGARLTSGSRAPLRFSQLVFKHAIQMAAAGWSLPGRPEPSSVHGRDRRAPPGPPTVHAAHSGRKLHVLDIQFDIHRKLADAAWRAQKVRTGDAYRAHDRHDGSAAEFLVLSVMATDTATGAARPPGPRLKPTPRLPDRSDRPYGAVQKQG